MPCGWLPCYADDGMPSRSASNARTSVTYCKPSRSGMRCSRSLSVGSLIQPSIGMALSVFAYQYGFAFGASDTKKADLTWMKNVAYGAVIKNHNLAQIRLHLGKILDISPVAERAVLSVISSRKVFALHLQPVDDRIGVLLHRRSEYD